MWVPQFDPNHRLKLQQLPQSPYHHIQPQQQQQSQVILKQNQGHTLSDQLKQQIHSDSQSRSSSIQQRVAESLRQSQQIPLKLVSQPAFLSKEAISLQQSLEKLKEVSQKKYQSKKADKQNYDIKETIQKDPGNQKVISKTPNFGVPPKQYQNGKLSLMDEDDQIFFNRSQVANNDFTPSPIQIVNQKTEQSDPDIHKIYQYEQSNESEISNEVINIYSTASPSKSKEQVFGQFELIATVGNVQQENKTDGAIQKAEEPFIQMPSAIKIAQQPFQVDEQDTFLDLVFRESETHSKSNESHRAYSKMSPEDANVAYLQRQKDIKSHLKKTKLSSKVGQKHNFTKKQKPPPKLALSPRDRQLKTVNHFFNSLKSPQKIEVINISRTGKKIQSAQKNVVSQTKEIDIIKQQLPQSSQKTLKKQSLLNEISSLDNEIKNMEYQLIADQRKQTTLPPQLFVGMIKKDSYDTVNKSLDNQISRQIKQTNYDHRGELLYKQGQLINEKKKILASQSQSKLKENELKECTFKPFTIKKSVSSNGLTQQIPEKPVECEVKTPIKVVQQPKPNPEDMYLKNKNWQREKNDKIKAKQLNNQKQLFSQEKVAKQHQIKPNSRSISNKNNDVSQKFIQSVDDLKTHLLQTIQMSEYYSSSSKKGPQETISRDSAIKKINFVDLKYQAILNQANMLKQQLENKK